jgi:hypothetical protein
MILRYEIEPGGLGMRRVVSMLSNLTLAASILCVAALPCAESEEPLTPQAREYLRKLATDHVQIGPTLRGDMPIVFGGGARYEIDKRTFAIVSKTHIK